MTPRNLKLDLGYQTCLCHMPEGHNISVLFVCLYIRLHHSSVSCIGYLT